jgi:hypothetical protein
LQESVLASQGEKDQSDLNKASITKIGFLFNHEQVHQIPHAVSVAYVLSTLSDSIEVVIFTSSDRQFDYLKQFETEYPDHRCSFIFMNIPSYLGALGAAIDKVLPFTKVMNLKLNLPLFKDLDVLVAPEKTSILLRTHFGFDNLKFIFSAHGSGDRKFGYNKEFGQFDMIFVSGPKTQNRMQEEGVLDNSDSAIVGYPKFDAVGAYTRKRKKYFDNDRLTVLYNPHFSPHLSSWNKMGNDILEYFYTSDEFNLIFAPHVMLFTRKIQISQEQFSIGWVRRIPERYYNCANIIIDTDSIACADMSYTLAADIYMGDVSSQFHEFLIHPRPCLFVNAHHVDWKDDPSYLNWHTGPVFDDIDKLDGCLRYSIASHDDFRAKQEELFQSTFDINPNITSSERAARAILDFVERKVKPAQQ